MCINIHYCTHGSDMFYTRLPFTQFESRKLSPAIEISVSGIEYTNQLSNQLQFSNDIGSSCSREGGRGSIFTLGTGYFPGRSYPSECYRSFQYYESCPRKYNHKHLDMHADTEWILLHLALCYHNIPQLPPWNLSNGKFHNIQLNCSSDKLW